MKLLQKDEKRYKTQFSRYLEAKIKPEDLEALYQTVHDKIRKDPVSKFKYSKLNHEQRKKQKREDLKKKKRKVIWSKKIKIKRKKTINCINKIKSFKIK
jgi:large subunit ribosomal protein L5e